MSNLIASDDAETIQSGSAVSLHFALRLPDGAEIDSTFDKAAAQLVIGDGNLLPDFEKYLLGLKAGAKREFQLDPEEAFGPRREENLQRLPLSRFEALVGDARAPEVGLMVSFAAPGGELPGVVQAVDGPTVVVDFNHPLAGYSIIFAVEILAVAPGPISA